MTAVDEGSSPAFSTLNSILEELTSPTSFTMPETNPLNPFVSLLQNFRLSFPFPANPQSDSQGSSANNTDVVKFTDPRPAVPPPLKIESDESAQRQSAAVVWQVYALGGYLLARWIWGKWKDKQNKDQPPSDENTSQCP